jgi:hypothetical protein
MNPEEVFFALRRQGRLPADKLRSALGVSRPTQMRAVRAAGASVLTIGRARRTSYVGRRSLRGNSAALPLFRIDQHASPVEVGQLHLAHPTGSLLDYRDAFEWPLDADMRDGWFEGIPYPLQDLRPEGFLGRAFARQNAALLQVGEDPREWSDDDVLYALSLLGSDTSGNYIVGEPAYRLWLETLAQPLKAVTDADLASTYAALAKQSMEQGMVGSFASGEFPKFTTLRELGGEPVHVLVKFSGSDGSPGTERWSDLLVCEHLASMALTNLKGITASQSTVHRTSDRTFLEIVRFDRHGAYGRSALCSWSAINHAFFGLAGRPWTEGAALLFGRGLIDADTRDAILRLWHFGQLIGNTDMHDGNLSFVPAPGLRLAPVYDMLPMLYAPQRGVELPERNFAPRLPLPSEREIWQEAARAATEFWSRASKDTRMSRGFRNTCARNQELVRDAASLSATIA